MTSDGSPYSRFQRALRSGNLALIHATAVELPYVPLTDALAILLVLDARHEERFNAAAVRWAGRLATEVPALELGELAGALESLVALPDERAQASLLALAERARRPAGAPASAELRKVAGTPYPPAAVVIRTIGSLRAALEQLGHQAAWTPVTDDEIIDALRSWTAEHGGGPTCPEWRQSGQRPGASTIIRRYGSWNAAVQAAHTK